MMRPRPGVEHHGALIMRLVALADDADLLGDSYGGDRVVARHHDYLDAGGATFVHGLEDEGTRRVYEGDEADEAVARGWEVIGAGGARVELVVRVVRVDCIGMRSVVGLEILFGEVFKRGRVELSSWLLMSFTF